LTELMFYATSILSHSTQSRSLQRRSSQPIRDVVSLLQKL